MIWLDHQPDQHPRLAQRGLAEIAGMRVLCMSNVKGILSSERMTERLCYILTPAFARLGWWGVGISGA